MNNVILFRQTSAAWMKTWEDKLKILDPDGWDRLNYEYSFYEEKITEVDFITRLFKSTLELKVPAVVINAEIQRVYNQLSMVKSLKMGIF